ncbi:hypothetical protein [Pseudomonas sp. 3A(2025)]
MKPHAELRLCAVPVCGGLVLSIAKALVNGWDSTELFSGFLFGFVIATVVGIPLLLWGDRRCGQFKGRHVLSALVQSLVMVLMVRDSFINLLLMCAIGGLTLGLLYTVVVTAIERLPVRRAAGGRQRWGMIVAVPVSGAVAVGATAMLFPLGLEPLRMAVFFALIGALLSMLVSWPVLWLIERFISTRWRYVLGGGISGVLIWLLFGAQFTPADQAALAKEVGAWAFLLHYLIVPFVLIGLLAGSLCTLLNALYEWRQYAKERSTP